MTSNGNVYGIINYRDQSRNQTFTYDPLNRLLSAQNAGTDCRVTVPGNINKFWGNTYVYDAWGNLTEKKLMTNQCSGENLSVTVDTNNRLQSGYGYDIAGNMVHDATENLNYAFDQENRITGAAPFTYTYDADGNRVEKSNSSTTPPTGTLYWYMSMGIVGESDLGGNLQSEYVFFDGERVARKNFPGSTVSYYFSDHLKTASVITDSAGNIKTESDYYPWGGELQFTNNDSNHYKFTGKERDQETGLDYFGARYYSNGLGRFVSADWSAVPVPVPYAHMSDPQTLNLYSYVRNIPTTTIDADGHGFLSKLKNWWTDGGWNENPEAQKERQRRLHIRAMQARTVISGMTGFTIGGLTPQQFVQGKTDQQLVDAQRQIGEFLLSKVDLLSCSSSQDVKCGIVLFPPMGAALDLELAETSGILREAAASKGNAPGMGSAPIVTAARAQEIGEAWVGPGYRIASDGRTLVSKDGLRIYRPPTFKPGQGKTQANLEQKTSPGSQPISNYHLDIK